MVGSIYLLVGTRGTVPIVWKVALRMRAGGTLDREGSGRRFGKRTHVVSATTAFDNLEVPPLAHTTGDLMITILVKTSSMKNRLDHLEPLTSGFERP